MTKLRELKNVETLLTWGNDDLVNSLLMQAIEYGGRWEGRRNHESYFRTYVVNKLPKPNRNSLKRFVADRERLKIEIPQNPIYLEVVVNYLGFLKSRWGKRWIPHDLENVDLSRFPAWNPPFMSHDYTPQDLENAYRTLVSFCSQYHVKRKRELAEAIDVEKHYLNSYRETPSVYITSSPVIHNLCVNFLHYTRKRHGQYSAGWLLHEASRHTSHKSKETVYSYPQPTLTP